MCHQATHTVSQESDRFSAILVVGIFDQGLQFVLIVVRLGAASVSEIIRRSQKILSTLITPGMDFWKRNSWFKRDGLILDQSQCTVI